MIEENKKYLELIESELKSNSSSEKTIQIYSYFISKYLENFDKNVSESTFDDVKNFLSSLANYSPKSIALAASSLRFFYKRISKNTELVNSIDSPKIQDITHQVLTKEEMKKLFSSAYTKKSRLMMYFLYSTGTRVSELVNLKIEDLDLDNKTGLVKNNKSRSIFLGEKLCSELKPYIEQRLSSSDSNPYLFPAKNGSLTPRNVQKIIKKAKEHAGIQKKVTPHTLRHSFAVHLLEDGLDAKKIQELLGKSRSENRASLEVSQIKNPFDSLDFGQTNSFSSI